VETIVSGITYDEFVKDIRIYYSVMKNVEVIGEAANMLTRHFRETYTELPWRQIVSMRNVLVHGYAQISDTDLWQTATNDIKPLREQVQRYLLEIDWRKWNQGEDPYTEMDNAAYKQAVNSARKMKVKGYAIEDITDITGLSTEEIEAL
jgi:uncharacterized protein with HEPN domain